MGIAARKARRASQAYQGRYRANAERKFAADRPAMLRVLAAGPVHGADAAAGLGWTLTRWWGVLWRFRGHWAITGKGLVLTERGRRAVARDSTEGK